MLGERCCRSMCRIAPVTSKNSTAHQVMA
uniref:Uncharacterized protein n=1 Tax=Rhizophora mucronata TaxID=61149 RepID=A0A2P2PBF5_RHIMU